MVGLRAQETLQAAVEAAMDGMAVVDGDGSVAYGNRGLAELLGYDDPADLEGETWQTLVTPEAAERLETTVLATLAGGERWHGRTWGRTADDGRIGLEAMLLGKPDGRTVWLLTDASGSPGGDHSVGHRTVLESVRDAVYTLDDEGRITWVNRVAEREFDVGYSVDELIGENVSLVLAPEGINRSIEAIRTMLTTDVESETFEITLQGAGGQEIPCELHLSLLPLVDGEFRGSVGVVRDVTERKRREQLLSVLNRVLRHNLRNELAIAAGVIEGVANDIDPAQRSRLARAEASLERVLDIGQEARQLQSVVESPDRDPVETVVDVLLEGARAAAVDAADGVVVAVEAGDDLGTVEIDPLVGRALEQLAANAAAHNDAETPHVWLSAERAGERLELSVADDGPGIPEVEQRVLTDLAETPLEHGSGLGLWLVKWVVATADGSLEIEERDPRGSVVRVRVPIADGD